MDKNKSSSSIMLLLNENFNIKGNFSIASLEPGTWTRDPFKQSVKNGFLNAIQMHKCRLSWPTY